jgi:hypothetical protein
MAERITHKKREIEVRSPEGGIDGQGNEPGEEHCLYVDGDLVPTERHDSGGFWTQRLPYMEFESLTELGQALVDHSQV